MTIFEGGGREGRTVQKFKGSKVQAQRLRGSNHILHIAFPCRTQSLKSKDQSPLRRTYPAFGGVAKGDQVSSLQPDLRIAAGGFSHSFLTVTWISETACGVSCRCA